MKTLILLSKFTLIIALLVVSSTNAISQKKLDVITLKNGNILKGKIVRQVPGDFVELKTRDNNFWKFDMEDVAEIRFEAKRKPKIKTDTISFPTSGLIFDVQMGVLAGNNDNQNSAPFSMLASGSYLFKSNISLGAGLGYESFDEAQMPVFAVVKYHTKLRGLNSFVFFKSGYSIPLGDKENGYHYNNSEDDVDSNGGWLINPGVGLRFGNGSSVKYTLSIGYRYQKLEHEWTNSYTEGMENMTEEYNRLSIHLGITF